MNELRIIRDAIFTALQESPDYRFSDPTVAKRKIKDGVCLGRLDPGQWSPEALVIARTEDGLPCPYEYNFWERVTEIANRDGCKLHSFDVTHFSVGFFQESKLAPDVARLIQQRAEAVENAYRHRLEYALASNNISSPIEQLFYVSWDIISESTVNKLDPAAYELSHYVLYPQFPITSDLGKAYLIDFAVLRFDADRYRQLVQEWRDRQDPYSDGNWISDPFPQERDDECNSNMKIAIELDSYKYHVEQMTPADFEYQKQRERFFRRDGWMVFSFCGREVNRDPMKCVHEVWRYLSMNKIV